VIVCVNFHDAIAAERANLCGDNGDALGEGDQVDGAVIGSVVPVA
jgi:hypothetical protein